MEELLWSRKRAFRALNVGSTKGDELIASGTLETVRIGSRRLIKITSVKRLAGMEV